ncbi:DUF2797 domain-containing protein [Mangrovibacterium diazotrophicum]|uniref:Uncharacterized protein DUF2797 n=1 Tax=Mangrovibacterium diazotrophicum TaxID=1261403 RepID=A0A419WAF3_9BACT|nr:DUF2797 domain-containing protein [Mangrovibacterium diazotrophicum]RKD92396.1 uncharacterized protein DUF2797 [Mangrovibacterium diazotrophicum]
MEYQGNILKMRSEFADPVRYFFRIGDQEIDMNALLGKQIRMQFDGQINCIACGKRTKTSFSQGFCYSCLQTAPEASETVMRPELSKSQFGIARDMKWAEEHDLIDHIVYLAVSSELKVGVTRHHQVPTRWIDQGASYAIRVAQTPNRHIAGVIEVFLKKYFTDKTNWRDMLKNNVAENFNLPEEKENVLRLLPAELRQYRCDNDEVMHFNYPALEFPDKIKSLSFDKEPVIEGEMKGIKGQYLLLDGGQVLNVRKHNGYYLSFSFNS